MNYLNHINWLLNSLINIIKVSNNDVNFNTLTFINLSTDYLNINSLFSTFFFKNVNFTLNSTLLNVYYNNLFIYNNSYLITVLFTSFNVHYFKYFSLLKFFFKINIIFIIIWTIFYLTFFENYIKQLISLNNLSKIFILNENEKEIGPFDDIIFFAILFFLILTSFIVASISILIYFNNILIWLISIFILVSIFILTIPVNLLIDFGLQFSTYVKGSSSSTNLLKELVFDFISIFIMFIRFIVQNIRFVFIFFSLFELLEWSFNYTNSIFVHNFNNYIVNYNYQNKNLINFFLDNSSNNVFLINSLLFLILFFYYYVHLLFLILIQISVYIGISLWLFFFLYSVKFSNKYEKYFFIKK